MPANKNGLKLLHNLSAPAGGTTPKRLYTYTTNDTRAQIEADAYFDGILNNGLNKGDIMLVEIDDDGTPDFKFYLVSAGGADVAIRGMGGVTIPSLTDNSTGTASDTIASISDTPTKNAIASLTAKVNLLLRAVN